MYLNYDFILSFDEYANREQLIDETAGIFLKTISFHKTYKTPVKANKSSPIVCIPSPRAHRIDSK